MSTNVSLTPELEEYAKAKVQQGLYGSMSELVRDALRLLRKQDIEYTQAIQAELKQAASEIDQGNISPLVMQEIIEEAESEFTAKENL